jgi:hypothetical protein
MKSRRTDDIHEGHKTSHRIEQAGDWRNLD